MVQFLSFKVLTHGCFEEHALLKASEPTLYRQYVGNYLLMVPLILIFKLANHQVLPFDCHVEVLIESLGFLVEFFKHLFAVCDFLVEFFIVYYTIIDLESSLEDLHPLGVSYHT
jgi:hypothetical protein